MADDCISCHCSGELCPQGSGACCWFDFNTWTVECVEWETQADCLTQYTNGYWHKDLTCSDVEAIFEPGCSGFVYPTDPPTTTTETPTTTSPPTTTTTTTTTTTVEPDCCDWDGNGKIYVSGECFFRSTNAWTENPENTWTLNTSIHCGDPVEATITCDPLEEDLNLKWTLTSFDLPCGGNPTSTGVLTPASCQNPPVWNVVYDDLCNCHCCQHCCNWDGTNARFEFGPTFGSHCYFEGFNMTEIEDNVWEFDGELGPCNGTCGDTLYIKIMCDPQKEVTDPNKWTLDTDTLSFPCIPNFHYTGSYVHNPSCDEENCTAIPPVFHFDGDWSDLTCQCWDWDICTEESMGSNDYPPQSNAPGCP